MKKTILILCSVGCVNVFAIDCPLGYFKSLKKIKCPESLIKEGTSIEVKKSKEYLIELEKVSNAKTIYIDVLNNLHQEDEINKYVNEKSFKDFVETNLFTNLLAAKTLEDKERYENILNKVDINNPYWCKVVDESRNNE